MSKHMSLDVDTEVEFYVRDMLEKIDDDELRGVAIRWLGHQVPDDELRGVVIRWLGYQVSDDELRGKIKECI